MSESTSDVDVIIVGAGAAGLGAAKTAAALGLSFVVLEASHRIGGRAYTERVGDGMPFDLGCHLLHSASLNPFTKIADQLGFSYLEIGYARNAHLGGRWASESELSAFFAFFETCHAAIMAAAAAGEDRSIADVITRDDPWTAAYDYFTSLEHSADCDQVSLLDHANYCDTGENWPLRQGYGALVARFGADVPVRLNAAVRRLDWSGSTVSAETALGTLRGRAAIVTVSTGILSAGDIRFDPALPDWTLRAIERLPLGCYNQICLILDGDPFGSEAPRGALIQSGPDDHEPMSFRLRPFGYDYVVGVTGGRFGDWLERAGVQASADFALEKLKQAFGSSIAKHVVGSSVTAWRSDPWARGAYSAAQPGHHAERSALARPVGERLFFAGEACSKTYFTTCHGAYLNGIDTAEAVARQLRPTA